MKKRKRRLNKSPASYNTTDLSKASQGHYIEAIANYDRAIQLKPDYTEAYYNRGGSNIALEEYGDAIEDFNQAIELNPENANAYAERGYSRYMISEEAAAMEDCNTAIRLKPDLAEAYHVRGDVHFDLDDHAPLLKTLTKRFDSNQTMLRHISIEVS